jgi:hypothetical protein
MLQNERLGPASAIWRLGVHGLSERDGLRHDQLQAQLSSQGGPLTPAKVGSVEPNRMRRRYRDRDGG